MGGYWEHKDGLYDYVPIDCIRRALYFSSKISYGDLIDLISVRFGIQDIRRLSYKFSTYVYPVDMYDDNDMYVVDSLTMYPNIRNANKKVIGHVIKDQLTDCGRVYRGKEIMKDINQRFKVNISYKQAWRGKHYAEQLLSGSAEEAFVKLPAYCHNHELAKSGTLTHILRDEFDRFKMVFIAIGAAVRSFVNCMRPIIIIDGAHLKDAFKGTMFLAVGMDGNNQILPIAFGVGKNESGDAWTWFLSKLKDGIADHPELAIISDRASSIDLAIRTVYPLAYHGLCC
ncbi:hypothetical protein E3N88_29208 [Mikania micrantha]|uniref:MULE transposase domain-containing protein n=1 Tax=Mikania micrantha TaxID=192012 RepID=A0A5N6MI64_9ASTR|nr:hypothetical protein E3N88_29208 [Mikania micrantha]